MKRLLDWYDKNTWTRIVFGNLAYAVICVLVVGVYEIFVKDNTWRGMLNSFKFCWLFFGGPAATIIPIIKAFAPWTEHEYGAGVGIYFGGLGICLFLSKVGIYGNFYWVGFVISALIVTLILRNEKPVGWKNEHKRPPQ